jgi:hypothetical protein
MDALLKSRARCCLLHVLERPTAAGEAWGG